jgi:hypothetical protein
MQGADLESECRASGPCSPCTVAAFGMRTKKSVVTAASARTAAPPAHRSCREVGGFVAMSVMQGFLGKQAAQ